jgi:hypothetical protein
VYLKARDAHLAELDAARKESRPPKPVLLPTQEHIVRACDLLMRGLAQVGIIALVDQATGYEDRRAKDDLLKILEQYIAPHLLPWTRKFPGAFFKEVYRLYGWKYTPGSTRRPQCVGNFINEYIYDQLPPGVLDKLRELNPITESGYRKHKHFQLLTVDTGNEHLDKQITSTMTLMRASDNAIEYKRLFRKVFPKRNTDETKDRPAMIIKVDENPGQQLELFPPSLFGPADRQDDSASGQTEGKQ